MNNSTEINYHALLYEENIYVVLHMLLIFWIPATIVLVNTKTTKKTSSTHLFLAVLPHCLLLGLFKFEAVGVFN